MGEGMHNCYTIIKIKHLLNTQIDGFSSSEGTFQGSCNLPWQGLPAAVGGSSKPAINLGFIVESSGSHPVDDFIPKAIRVQGTVCSIEHTSVRPRPPPPSPPPPSPPPPETTSNVLDDSTASSCQARFTTTTPWTTDLG